MPLFGRALNVVLRRKERFGDGWLFPARRRFGNWPSRSRRSMVAVDMATTWATVGRSMKMGVMGIFFALMLHSP